MYSLNKGHALLCKQAKINLVPLLLYSWNPLKGLVWTDVPIKLQHLERDFSITMNHFLWLAIYNYRDHILKTLGAFLFNPIIFSPSTCNGGECRLLHWPLCNIDWLIPNPFRLEGSYIFVVTAQPSGYQWSLTIWLLVTPHGLLLTGVVKPECWERKLCVVLQERARTHTQKSKPKQVKKCRKERI